MRPAFLQRSLLSAALLRARVVAPVLSMLARNLVGAVEPGRLVFAAAPAADRGSAAGIALGRGSRTAGRAVGGTRRRLRRAVPRHRRLGRGRLAGRRALVAGRRGGYIRRALIGAQAAPDVLVAAADVDSGADIRTGVHVGITYADVGVDAHVRVHVHVRAGAVLRERGIERGKHGRRGGAE